MRSLILCEGFDDAYILGYFLHKTLGFRPCDSQNFAKKYTLLQKESKNQGISYYQKGNDHSPLAIWSVGGKDAFLDGFSATLNTSVMNNEERIDQLFILQDKDDDTVEDRLLLLENELNQSFITVNPLQNNVETIFSYEVEGENYLMKIIPIIIPFDEKGALETILMEAISESEDGSFIVGEAKKYVENLLNSGTLNKYLQKERLILKAKYSSTIAITNPDRSTAVFDTLLMSHDWEKKESIQRHFSALTRYLQ